MLLYLVRRALTAVVSVVLASLVVFSALLAIPGDPAEIILGLDASPEARTALRDQLGLNRPAPVRYLTWVAGALRGDLGESIVYQRPVRALIADRLGVSVPLALGAALIAGLIALPLGLLAALRRGTWVDPVVTSVAQLGAAVPSFWLGLLFVLLFAVELGWLPAGGFSPWARDPVASMRSLVLPMLALGLGQAAVMTRMTRSSMIEALAQDYVRTARAKGLPPARVTFGHALRNALVTLVTILGLSLTNVFIGSIVIEQVFALPGLGQLALTAIGTRDLPLVQGEILLYATTIIVLSFLVDASYALLDPRIRYEA
ncbi:MAG: ABC transporter permease [Trueperaceae bacterium]|nr:ABC transporter permease [Trueperaceae bacterium]